MNEIKKNPVEESQGIAGFLIPEKILPSNLARFFGIGSTFKLTAMGVLVEIEGEQFFKVEAWKLRE
ncbi:MAG TPA: hypothetical protein PKV15_07145 [Syntrophomonadaceae bacterium]|jgi:hypothetical protein|nr:hypothetical protein [Syntrophomonadaceae bacterium]HPF44459.1 hypothetical protein [Syntrophomonadaceae bacterium]